MDALALLIRKTSGQQKASSEDAIAVLSLLLRQHSTFLVIDGLDECQDVDALLDTMAELCRTSDCRVILVSRPDLKVTNQYNQNSPGYPRCVYLRDEHILPASNPEKSVFKDCGSIVVAHEVSVRSDIAGEQELSHASNGVRGNNWGPSNIASARSNSPYDDV